MDKTNRFLVSNTATHSLMRQFTLLLLIWVLTSIKPISSTTLQIRVQASFRRLVEMSMRVMKMKKMIISLLLTIEYQACSLKKVLSRHKNPY